MSPGGVEESGGLEGRERDGFGGATIRVLMGFWWVGREGEKYGHDHGRIETEFMTGSGGGDNVGQDF